jgi:hypothetical protein
MCSYEFDVGHAYWGEIYELTKVAPTFAITGISSNETVDSDTVLTLSLSKEASIDTTKVTLTSSCGTLNNWTDNAGSALSGGQTEFIFKVYTYLLFTVLFTEFMVKIY